jgi:hypothetical protein
MSAKITVEDVREAFDYDAATGNLIWRPRPSGTTGNNVFNSRFAGKVAGSPHDAGYIGIVFHRTRQYLHRLVWAHQKGEWPTHEIDHINGDRSDSRIENLRPATTSQNRHNRRPGANRTGMKGVTFEPRTGRFQARIKLDNKQHNLGTFATAEDAHAAYCRAAENLHGEYRRVA